MKSDTENKFQKNRIFTANIDSQKEIVNEVFKLLERRKHANIY